MKKLSSQPLALAALAVGIGLILASNPRCREGCRTLAEHLINHGLKAIFIRWGA